MANKELLSFIEECFERDETGDAELLSYLHKNKICHSEGQWFVWNGNHWQEDEKKPVSNLVADDVASCYLWAAAQFLEMSTEYNDIFDQKSGNHQARGYNLRRASKINNVLKRAVENPDFIVTSDDWAVEPMELPVNNGIVNLRNGSFREACPEDYIRCPCPVDWLGLNEPSPLFEKFILEIFNGDEDMVRSVQRILGYALTGQQFEHILPIFVGSGGNGKDCLLGAIQHVLGSLAGPVGSEVMISSRSNSTAHNMAWSLRFRRLAYVSETGNGSYLDANRVKQLTGGGKIQAKQLYKDVVEFDQQHTLILMTNFKPRTDSDDNAIWRRLMVIEFPLSFVEKPTQAHERQVDKHLPDKLKTESAGILAWLVRGCLDWQEQGLNPCQTILDATLEYRDSEDLIGHFLEDEMIVNPDAKISISLLCHLYREWAIVNGLRPLSQIRLGKKLVRRFEKEKSTDGWYWLGLEQFVSEEEKELLEK